MRSDVPLDYVVFQLSPRHSRCELFVSGEGETEKLASGSVKPFLTHLKVAEEQVALAVQSIKLEVEKHTNAEAWFTKGTLERFVRFVSTPEILELVNTYDAEMSQLEAARKIYSQGTGEQHSGSLGGDRTRTASTEDATKKELLRAIDVRLLAVSQDLSTASARATAAGFNPDSVSDLQLFAGRFGAHRLNEACTKYISLCKRRPNQIDRWKQGVDVRSSCESDMSIDGPTENVTGWSHKHPAEDRRQSQIHHQQQQQLDQERPSKCQRPKSSSSFHLAGRNVNEKDAAKKQGPRDVSEKERKNEEEALSLTQTQTESTPLSVGQPGRRLSVQDRINLFENKQKENSNTSSGGGGKPIIAAKPVVLRRLSSDLSSSSASVVTPEKGVSRRWSGASDMSIEVSGEKKDVEIPLCTPSVSSSSLTKLNVSSSGLSEDKDQKGLNANGTLKEQNKVWSNDQEVISHEKVGANDQESVKRNIEVKGHVGAGFQTQSRVSSDQVIGGVKKDVVPQTELGDLASKDVGIKDQVVTNSNSRRAPSHFRSLSGQFDGDIGLKLREASSSQLKGFEADSVIHQPQWRSFTGELEKMGKKYMASLDDIKINKTKLQKPVSTYWKDESSDIYDNSKMVFTSKKVSPSLESSTISTVPIEQVQRVRQTKGNQELNDELKMKANELEKLFAEHQLRVPSDQSGSARRSKPAGIVAEQEDIQQFRNPVGMEISPEQSSDRKETVAEPIGNSRNMEKFDFTPPMNIVSKSNGDLVRCNFSELSLSDDSKGKFYQRYMQKRDAKLREEWVSKGAEKKAKMKAMQDNLEKSRSELKAMFLGSINRQDSVSSAQRQTEKLRSFNYRLNHKRDQSVDSIHSDEDDEIPQFLEQKSYGQDRLFNDSYSGDAASRITQTKKFIGNRSSSSSTPRSTSVTASRLAVKVANTSSGRRRAQTENPLAQSVPNFSDLRKENTKPYSAVSKTTTRSQMRNNSRCKNGSEEPAVREEKSLRKSFASPVMHRDPSSPLNLDSIVLATLKVDKDQIELSSFGKNSKSVESKPFLRKGGGDNIAKLKSSIPSKTSRDKEEFDDETTFEAEDSVDMIKEEEENEEDEEEEELETMEMEDANMEDNGKSRLSQASDRLGIFGSENGDFPRSLSQLDPSSVPELPASMPSTFHTVGLIQESPGESPMSWNSRLHHPFSYPNETSDVDASMDSPIGSPAFSNSSNLAQADGDAARMRKKWGSAQKPTVVLNSSNQSRKDVTKGFKRLLKFGRKSRGTESSVDWISATTSEGDDDMEDGRDPANRSSEDLRKSRMGFSQGPFDDSCNESEMFNEQVQDLESSIPAPPANFRLREEHISGSSLKAPRSFFSLSSFRSRGSVSDSKLRRSSPREY